TSCCSASSASRWTGNNFSPKEEDMMSLKWFDNPGGKPKNQKRAPAHKNRRNHVGRATGIETLEQRTLLSVSLGLAPTAGTIGRHVIPALVSTSMPQAPVV